MRGCAIYQTMCEPYCDKATKQDRPREPFHFHKAPARAVGKRAHTEGQDCQHLFSRTIVSDCAKLCTHVWLQSFGFVYHLFSFLCVNKLFAHNVHIFRAFVYTRLAQNYDVYFAACNCYVRRS